MLREYTQSLTLTRKAGRCALYTQKSNKRIGERKELRMALPFVIMFVFILFVFTFRELSIR